MGLRPAARAGAPLPRGRVKGRLCGRVNPIKTVKSSQNATTQTMADVAAPQYEGPLLHARFSCRTVAPWDEVRWGVSTSAGLRLWMNELYGEDIITYSQLAGVRTWMAAAQVGDVAHLNEDGGLVGPGQGDFEIRCNSV